LPSRRLREEFRKEAFPCQHITQESWEQIAQTPGLSEKIAERFLEIAAELEKAAEVEQVASARRA
jgi:hypothetical protein